jgi:hypothetical protein
MTELDKHNDDTYNYYTDKFYRNYNTTNEDEPPKIFDPYNTLSKEGAIKMLTYYIIIAVIVTFIITLLGSMIVFGFDPFKKRKIENILSFLIDDNVSKTNKVYLISSLLEETTKNK